uniref:Uncharacterized protein TCIL3000_3_3230 n=1 Tax=Trypanosoma congolense (strain IL3000) TaxID=1068625 RepID=G0UKI4_TRYCI|nr:unnamed protein product [Trypanosoma congolense IL3000]
MLSTQLDSIVSQYKHCLTEANESDNQPNADAPFNSQCPNTDRSPQPSEPERQKRKRGPVLTVEKKKTEQGGYSQLQQKIMGVNSKERITESFFKRGKQWANVIKVFFSFTGNTHTQTAGKRKCGEAEETANVPSVEGGAEYSHEAVNRYTHTVFIMREYGRKGQCPRPTPYSAAASGYDPARVLAVHVKCAPHVSSPPHEKGRHLLVPPAFHATVHYRPEVRRT